MTVIISTGAYSSASLFRFISFCLLSLTLSRISGPFLTFLFFCWIVSAFDHRISHLFQVRVLFLQWIPWILRMSRPGEKITRKTILMETKLKELDIKENSSKSLLANVLDMDDDFQQVPNFPCNHIYPQVGNTAKPTKNGEFLRLNFIHRCYE